MDAEEGCGRTGDEDAGLVDEAVDRVEGTVAAEGVTRGGSFEEQGRGHALVDGVFGDVDEEEGEHVGEEEGACAAEVLCKAGFGAESEVGTGGTKGGVGSICLGYNGGAERKEGGCCGGRGKVGYVCVAEGFVDRLVCRDGMIIFLETSPSQRPTR